MDHNFRPLKPFFKIRKPLENPHRQLSNAFLRLKNHLMDQKLWTIIVECISTSIKYHINTTLIFCRSHFLQIPLCFVWRRDCFCKSHFFVPVLRRDFCTGKKKNATCNQVKFLKSYLKKNCNLQPFFKVCWICFFHIFSSRNRRSSASYVDSAWF